MAAAALGLGIVSLVVSLRHPAPTEEAVRKIVDAELACREREFIDANKPRMAALLTEYFEFEKITDWQPATIHELYEPIIEMMEAASSAVVTEPPGTK